MAGTWIFFESKECHSEHCFFQTCHVIGMFWDICASMCCANRQSSFVRASKHAYICLLRHSQYCVCICWPWLIPQDGATPLYVSAQNGCKEVVEILLQNRAEVNAACKVIYDEWTDVIHRNACQGGRNEGQSVGNGIGNGRLYSANCLWIRLMTFHSIVLHIHAYGIKCD